MIDRRSFVAGATLALAACRKERVIEGGFNGASVERGHLLRQALPSAAPANTRKVDVLIAGGGIAGLSAARALRLAGVEDFLLLDLEDSAGGNSRGAAIGKLACPLGAHYLPVPGDDAAEVRDFLAETGVAKNVAGKWSYDERHLCHSPQERLFINGQWQDGLLPVQAVGEGALAQYRQFSKLVADANRHARFRLPLRGAVPAAHRALDAVTFASWLDRQGLDDAHLRWYLDYCCRDDYGAGSAIVSAWAGLHYFASRHGFAAPGDKNGERDPLLTWPEGNAWLVKRLADPLGDRVLTGRVVTRIAPGKHFVQVDAYNVATQQIERYEAAQCIASMPLFVTARVLNTPSRALSEAVTRMRHAPWAVVNIHIEAPLHDRPGAPPSWDNVIYGARGLGYVDAGHQKLNPLPEPTILTYYRSMGDDAQGRARLLSRDWATWRDDVLDELSVPHPDLRAKTLRLDVARWGHAMAIPAPGLRSSTALASLQRTQSGQWRRLHFAHSDLSGYSVFEEAFTHGWRAGNAAHKALA
ncbi:MAG TPA: FAD-dependent oxidoreductase [Ramlibacter sp.]|nr:FAD-dependent oxidoreductase [Ramlibacter sp.]